MSDALFAARPGDAVAPDGATVLFVGEDGRREPLTRDEAAVLGVCATFAPIEFHVDRVARESGWPREVAARVVGDLQRRQLIAPLSAFVDRRDVPREPLGAPLIVIRSFERPEGLRALLDSLLADERRYGVARRYAIVDDSRDAACVARTRALVESFARQTASSVHLLDATNRAAALARVLGDAPAACRAMLDPDVPSAVTGSRTWNWAVLLGAGGGLSILDDDTSFPVRRFVDVREAFDLVDGSEPIARWFDGAIDLPVVDRDPYATMGDAVGQANTTLLARHGFDPQFALHRSPSDLRPYRGERVVLGAIPGTYGTIPLDSSIYLAHLGPDSQADLFRTPYRPERLAADRVAQGYDAPRLISSPLYTPLLIDDRDLLPFAGTWGRVDDTYFLMLTMATVPDAAFLHVPLLLGHADYAPRDRLGRATKRPLVLDRNAFVAHVFAKFASSTSARQSRALCLEAIGRHCAELAAGRDTDLNDAVLRWRSAMFAQLVGHLSDGLARYPDAPPAWRAHVAAMIEANVGQARSDRLPDGEVAHVRTALQQVADVAPHWPATWERARSAGVDVIAPRVVAQAPNQP